MAASSDAAFFFFMSRAFSILCRVRNGSAVVGSSVAVFMLALER